MIRLSAKPSPETCQAVVLQLDICRFTTMSQNMSPSSVAEMVHAIFSKFDAEVQERGLFKMDTIGDAYIVAGLLPSEPDKALSPGGFEQESARVCRNVLDVAGAMIKALALHRAATGQDIDGRIGISVGTVVSGVLGRLQPRFHILGPGMRHAEMLEQTGRVGAVHVSELFLRALCYSRSLSSERTQTLNLSNEAIPSLKRREMLQAPAGWRIVESIPHLGVVSPKRNLQVLSRQAANLFSPQADATPKFSGELGNADSDIKHVSTIVKSPVAIMHFSNGYSGAGSATLMNIRSRNGSPAAGSHSPFGSICPSRPSTPEASNSLPAAAGISSTVTPSRPRLKTSEGECVDTEVRSPLRARVMHYLRSGLGAFGEGHNAVQERSRASPIASLVFRGSMRNKELPAESSSICSPNPATGPETPGANLLRRLSLVSSFLSRRSNESSETKHHPRIKTPSAATAVDELEGTWTSYILCPDAESESEEGVVFDSCRYPCSKGEVDMHLSCKESNSVEGLNITAHETVTCLERSVGLSGVELLVEDNQAAGKDWLAAALRQRAELQELETITTGEQR